MTGGRPRPSPPSPSPASEPFVRLPARWLGGRRAVLALALLVIAMLWLMVAADAWRSRQETLRATEARAGELAGVVAEQTARMLDSINLYLGQVLGDYRVVAPFGPLALDDMAARVRRDLAVMPFIRAVLVIGPDGRLSFDSASDETRGMDLSDRPYFRAFQHAPAGAGQHAPAGAGQHAPAGAGPAGAGQGQSADQVYIGVPVLGRSSGLRFLPTARADMVGGTLHAVAVAVVEPEYLLAFYGRLGVGRHGGVALVRRDGRVLLRIPVVESLIGADLSAHPLFTRHLPQAEAGVAPASLLPDGTARLLGWAAVPGTNLVATVALAETEALAQWRTRTQVSLAAVTVASLTVLAFALLVAHRQRQRDLAAQAVAVQAEALARSNLELQRLAYVASHDLQEPLRTIASYVQLLERRLGPALAGETRDFMDYVVQGVFRMQALIGDLLTYLRLDHPGETEDGEDMGPVALDAVLAEVVDNLRAALAEAAADVDIGPLPVVRGHRLQLVSLFQNLLSNAAKYRDPIRPCRIGVSAEDGGDGFATITVSDTGIGIPAAYQVRIFDIFQRLHTRQEYPGTGIGLAIVKRTVDRHGGTIHLVSTPGVGSRFILRLPLHRAA